MITDPRFAPRRTDLPWLRRRRRPRAADPAPTPTAGHDGSPLDEFLSGHSTGHHEHVEPAPPQPRAPAPKPAPAPPAPPPARVSTSLDLDEPAPAAPSARRPARPSPPEPTGPQRRRRVDERVRSGARMLLSPDDPTVTLTRLQSGIGTLAIEAAVSADVGDLRVGAAYELSDGLQMTMQVAQGNRFAPPHAKRPVLVGSKDRFERIGIDLRQVRYLNRMIVYAFSEGRQPLQWGGTLLTTTFGGGRIELPLDSLSGGDSAVLLSIYQVRGELVLRAEMQSLFGDVREACRAYGFERITWLDDRTPVE